MKKISIIGCGTIGTAIGGYIEKKFKGKVGPVLLYDQDASCAQKLSSIITGSKIAKDMKDAIKNSDLIVEAASASAAGDVLKGVIDAEKDAIFMSIGGLLGQESLLDEAEQKGIKIMLPSGAVAGIDALKAAKIAGITSVRLTTRKPPKALTGAPFILEKGIALDEIKEETVIFEGSASEAMKGFPKNINVSALISLAGLGPDATLVKIVVSPAYSKNTHEITVESNAGNFLMRTENVPSPDNPKTSYLASLAAMATIDGYFRNVRIGT